MYTLRMLSYDHQGGGGGVLTPLTSTSLMLRNMYTLLTCCTCFLTRFCVVTAGGARGFAASCTKDHHHKRFKMAQVNHKQNILLRLIIFEVVCGVNLIEPYRTIVAGTQQMDGTWKHLKKWRPLSMLHKKKHTAGHDVTALPCCSLWLLHCHKRSGTEASRRGKNCKSECRPGMIRMIENHRFLMFLFGPLKSKIEATRRRKKRTFSLLSHTPANRNECPCCKHFLTTPANTRILSLSLKNQNFKFVTLTRAPGQPVA